MTTSETTLDSKMTTNDLVKSELIFLRALESTDLERTHQWHNDTSLYSTLGGTFHYVSLDVEKRWLQAKMQVSTQETNLAICLTSDRSHIGNIYLRDIDWVSRNAQVHLFIGDPDQRSRGFGQEAIQLIVQHAFEDLGLGRLYLYVLAENASAIHAYEKSGFSVEGNMKNHAFKNGTFKDVLVMGICVPHLVS